MTHPNKHIREAIEHAISRGWRFVPSKGRPFGILYRPAGTRDGHHFTVASTPRNPEDHAKDLRRKVDRCPHS